MKDTQAKMLVEKLGTAAVIISTGEVLRAALAGKPGYERFTELVIPHKEALERGSLLPPEILQKVVTLLIFEQIKSGKTTLIFTGWPRGLEHLHDLDDLIKELQDEGLKVVPQFILLNISEETSKKRAEYRRKTESVVRKDDQEEVVEQRLRTYRDLTEPMVQLLIKTARLPESNRINADLEKEEIHKRILTVLS